MGMVLGLIALAAGAAAVLLAFSYRDGLSGAAETVSDGLGSARSAVEAISSGASSSSDLVTRVHVSLQSSGEVLCETGITLGSTRELVDRLGVLSSSAATELAELNRRASMLALGRDPLGGTVSNLEQAGGTAALLANRMDTLRVGVTALQEDLMEVAAAVESLQTDMFSAEAAFGEAEDHLERAAESAGRLSGSDGLFWALVAVSGLVLLTGLHLVLLSVALAQIRQSPEGGRK
jgi:hypothetical protein